MDVQLGNIIEKIRKEGVEEARQMAENIVREAKAKAEGILEEAGKRAARMEEEAGKRSEEFQKSGELAVRQAARDTVLQLKTQIQDLFDRVFKREMSGALNPETVQAMILRLVEQWGRDSAVEISVSDEDLASIEKLLFAGTRKELKKTLVLHGSPDIEHGFRIGLRGENVYYDFTDESIAQTLKQFLKPRLKEVLDRNNG
ncbi:hypothetical protein JW906_15680 [bacterium]|nr:hypothetical protein [bacterium]